MDGDLRPQSFGDVTGEYRALIEAEAVVPTCHELIWVEGPDAVSFLQGIISQNVEAMRPGQVARSLLLTPKGKPVALLWVLRGDHRVGLVTDAGFGVTVAETLSFYRIRVKAEIRSDERNLIEVWGPGAPARFAVSGWRDDGELTFAELPLTGSGRVLTAGPVDVADLPLAGMIAATTVRIEAGEPVMGRDVDSSAIPHETGLVEDAVDLGKGCFLGYELVERVQSRGSNTPRSLRGVVMTTNLLPPEGATVWYQDAEVGTLSSVGESLRMRAPVGLATVKRVVDPGAAVEVRFDGGSAPAVIEELPLVD